MGAYDDLLVDIPKPKGAYDDLLAEANTPEPSLKDKIYKAANKLFQPSSVINNETVSGNTGFDNKGALARVLEDTAQPNNLKAGSKIVDGLSGIAEVGARKGYAGIGRIEAGAIKALADVLGSNTLSNVAKDQQSRANEIEQGAVLRGSPVKGFSGDSIVQDLPNAATNAIGSVITTAPSLAVGAVAPELVLPAIFGTTGMQEYGQGRDAGLNPAGAALRAVPQAAFEVIGEKLGGSESLAKALSNAVKGNGVAGVGSAMLSSALKEIPSEELTTTGQFLTDKLPGVGINQDAGLAEYGNQVKDTALATLLQSGGMGAGGSIINSIASKSPQVNEAINQPITTQPVQPQADTNSIVDALTKATQQVAPDRLEISQGNESTANADDAMAEQLQQAYDAKTPSAEPVVNTGSYDDLLAEIKPAEQGAEVQNNESDLVDNSTPVIGAPDNNVDENQPAEPVKKSSKPKAKVSTLLGTLKSLGGVTMGDKLDVTGEDKKFAVGGYNQVFTHKSRNSLKGHIESGSLDDYLPYNMRLESQTQDSEAYDSTEAYDYLADKIRNGERVLHYDVEQEVIENKFYQEAGADAQSDIQAIDELFNEDEINEQLQVAGNYERNATTEARQFKPESTSSDARSSIGNETGTQSGRISQAQTDEVTRSEVSGARDVVTQIVKRRAAANQIGKSKQFDSAVKLAKDFMNGESVNPNKFKNAAILFKNDPLLSDQFNKLHELAKPQAKVARTDKSNAIDGYKKIIANATSTKELQAVARDIQNDESLSDAQAQTLDDAVFEAQDKFNDIKVDDAGNSETATRIEQPKSATDLLGDDTASKQAIADAERTKDAKRNAGNDNSSEFNLSGSDSEADQAAAHGAQALFSRGTKSTINNDVQVFKTTKQTQPAALNYIGGEMPSHEMLIKVPNKAMAIVSDNTYMRVQTLPDGNFQLKYEAPWGGNKNDFFAVSSDLTSLITRSIDRLERSNNAIEKAKDSQYKNSLLGKLEEKYGDVFSLGSSTQSKSRYITHNPSGLKIRISDHELPLHYEKPDIDLRINQSTEDQFNEIVDYFEGGEYGSASTSAFSRRSPSNGMYERQAVRASEESGSLAEHTQQQMAAADGGNLSQSENNVNTIAQVRQGNLTVDEVVSAHKTGGDAQFSNTQTNTQAFKDWFGESKVVDADGNPQVVYHGTDKNFNKVNMKKGAQGLFWFTSDKSAIESGDVGAAGNGVIIDMYAKLENPAGWKEYDKFGIGELIARGFDGAILPESDGTFVGFIFNPNQVKSASKNKGSFNPSNNDIRFSNTSPTRGISVDEIKKAIANDIYNQDVDVYQSMADAPIYIQVQAKSEGANGVEGFFDGKKNRVALIANNLPNAKRAIEVARHELIGHYGMENMLGKDLIGRLANRVLKAEKDGNKTILEVAKHVDKTQPGLSDFRRAKEMIAVMAERNMQNDIVKRVMDAIRKFLKEIGFTKEDITDVKISILLREAQEYLKQTGRTIAEANDALAFSKSNQTETEAKSRGNIIFRRDELGRIQLTATGKAYDVISEVANNLFNKANFGMASPELRKLIRHFKADMQKAMETAGEVAKNMSPMSIEDRSMVSDVVEKMVKTGVVPPDHIVKIATGMQQAMDTQTDELVELGMLSKDSAERWRGKYLPRFYKRDGDPALTTWAQKLLRTALPIRGFGGGSLKGRGLFQEINVNELAQWESLGWEVRDNLWKKNRQGKLELIDPNKVRDTEQVIVWRDYTPAERESMNENRDSLFRFVMGYTSMQNDIALGRMFDSIAKNQEWTRSRPSEGYVKVPDSEIAETGGVKRYGNLAGLYVKEEILSHISQYEESSEMWKYYKKALSFWKMGRTVLNPVSHMNNVVSNLTMAHFAGVSYWDGRKYAGALRDFVKGSDLMTEAKDAGLMTGDITRSELISEMPDDIKEMMDQQDSKIKKSVKTTYNILTFGLTKPMSKAYRFEDDFFKYLIYKDARLNGLSPDDAVDYATRYIFNYDDLPKTARTIRDVGIPFFAYTYKAVPALAHTAFNYPWRFAAPALAIGGLNAVMFGLAADDDDEWYKWFLKQKSWIEFGKGAANTANKIVTLGINDDIFNEHGSKLEAEERKNLAPWMQGKSALGTEKSIRLGTDDKTGLPIYMDVSRMIPGGDVFDLTNQSDGVALPAPIMPSNPVLTTIAAMFWNKDTFTGKDVTDQNDTTAEKSKKRIEWLLKQLSPAIAPTGYHFDRLMQAVAQMADTTIEIPFVNFGNSASYTGYGKDGLPVQPKYAGLNTIGIKAKPIDLELSADISRGQDFKEFASVKAEYRQLVRMLDKKAISQREYDRRTAELEAKAEVISNKE